MTKVLESISGHDLVGSDRELAMSVMSSVRIEPKFSNADGHTILGGIDAIAVMKELEAHGFEVRKFR